MEAAFFQPESLKRILSIGRYRAPRNRPITPVRTKPGTCKVELITAGEVWFEEFGRERLFGCGALFWHSPGEFTICRAVPQNPYECISILFEAEPRADGSGKDRMPRVSRWEDPAAVRVFADEVLNHFHTGLMDRFLLCRYIHATLSYQIFRYHYRIKRDRRSGPLQSLLEYIDDNPGQDLSLRTLANYAELSVSHLHALFRQHLDQTPHAWILERRLELARSLLAGTHLRIREVAEKCGFVNSETFNRVFRKSQGATPSEYRAVQQPPA